MKQLAIGTGTPFYEIRWQLGKIGSDAYVHREYVVVPGGWSAVYDFVEYTRKTHLKNHPDCEVSLQGITNLGAAHVVSLKELQQIRLNKPRNIFLTEPEMNAYLSMDLKRRELLRKEIANLISSKQNQ